MIEIGKGVKTWKIQIWKIGKMYFFFYQYNYPDQFAYTFINLTSPEINDHVSLQ